MPPKFEKKKLHRAIAAVIAASTAAGAAGAANEIEEVVVTATKRPASAQDLPVTVQALTETAMNDLGITNFTDYLIQLPGITAGGSGPGQNTIYIRGLASTTPNLTTAGVAGLAPNVALYLDEQPLSQPGRNLDVYTADLARIEVLSGPQGTLFGASSQAGNVRLITNKPDPTGVYGRVRLGSALTKGGEPSNNVEAVLNVPVNSRLTLRGVGYVDNKGGYIDNVAGSRDASESGRFRSAGTVRANGVPVSAQRAGFQANADLSAVTFLPTDNTTRTEKDINETTYSGARLSGLLDINEDWSLTVSHMRQTLDSEGVFFADPDLDDMEIQRFEDDSIEDAFDNTNWTLEGRLGALDVLYTGAFTDRDTDQIVDYTDYLFVGQYLPYYICDGSVTYPGAGVDPAGTCQPPNLFVKSTTDTEVWSHELRFNTPVAHRVRGTFGVFASSLELKERNDFTYPGSVVAAPFGAFAPNFPFTTGYTSDPGPFPEGVIFRNDVKRTDEQVGVFGEVTWDISEAWAVTLGARWYDIEVDFEGSANASFCNSFQDDANAFGTDISDLYNGDGQFTFHGSCDTSNHITYTLADIDDPETPSAVAGALQAPSSAKTDGVIGKATLSWMPTNDLLFYGTWSEGFRPGLLNRPGGAAGPGGYTVPFALNTDDVVNYEVGWKLDLLERTLRVNGNVFFVQIEDLQTTIFDPSIVNLFFSDNAADGEITGIESDFIWNVRDNLTLGGSVSLLDAKITKVITPTDDVVKGDDLAYAPEFQANLRARYHWYLDAGMTVHVMPHVAYSSEAQSDVIRINNQEVNSWVLVGLTVGVTADQWSAELFADNLFDEEAELARSFVFDRERVSYARPRTVGLRGSFEF